MTPARLARGLYKTLKWLFLATLILILIAAGALYYLLGSDSGYRQLPDLIARFTPYTLEYDTLDGHLLGDQRWQNLHLHGGTLPTARRAVFRRKRHGGSVRPAHTRV